MPSPPAAPRRVTPYATRRCRCATAGALLDGGMFSCIIGTDGTVRYPISARSDDGTRRSVEQISRRRCPCERLAGPEHRLTLRPGPRRASESVLRQDDFGQGGGMTYPENTHPQLELIQPRRGAVVVALKHWSRQKKKKKKKKKNKKKKKKSEGEHLLGKASGDALGQPVSHKDRRTARFVRPTAASRRQNARRSGIEQCRRVRVSAENIPPSSSAPAVAHLQRRVAYGVTHHGAAKGIARTWLVEQLAGCLK